jgi:hypothetical protein
MGSTIKQKLLLHGLATGRRTERKKTGIAYFCWSVWYIPCVKKELQAFKGV